MTDADLAAIVTASLFSIAPDLEGEAIDPNLPFREQFEIDSMDFLNFIIDLHRRTGIEVAEPDYAQLANLSGAVRYLKSRLGAEGAT
jgi:acyl carrier protein